MLLSMVILECLLFCIRKTIDNFMGPGLKSWMLTVKIRSNVVGFTPGEEQYITVSLNLCIYNVVHVCGHLIKMLLFFGVLFLVIQFKGSAYIVAFCIKV